MAATWVEADPSITAACDEESTRYAMGGFEMRNHPTEPDRVVVAATDSRCIAVGVMDGHVQCGDSIIVPKSIMPKSKAEQNKASKAIGMKKCIHYEADRKKWEAPAYDRTADPVDGRFPKYTEVLPHVHGGFLSLSIDPRLLYDLAIAVGCGVDDHRSLELLIDIEAVERYVKNHLPDEANFRDDVKNHVLAHVTKADGSSLTLAVDPKDHSVETIDDDKRLAFVVQHDWIMVDYMPADATVLEWQDELWRKVVARTKFECGHVRNCIPVVGHGRIGAIMPLFPERERQTTGAEVYEEIRKLAVEACKPKRTNEESVVPNQPALVPPVAQETFPDQVDDHRDDEDGEDVGDDSDDQTSCEYGETHGNDMNLDVEEEPHAPAETFSESVWYGDTPAASDPMAQLLAIAGM